MVRYVRLLLVLMRPKCRLGAAAPAFIVADELFELADKGVRFVLVDEFGCLHGIDEELDFR